MNAILCETFYFMVKIFYGDGLICLFAFGR